MSILIFKPEGVTFDISAVDDNEFITQTPLAVNYSYAKDGKIKTIKKNCYDPSTWSQLIKLTEFPTVIHINEKDKELLKKKPINWSPVIINEEVVIAGAGPILKINGERAKTYSDVKMFTNKALRNFTKRVPEFLFSNAGIWMMESILTSRAAMVALRADGSYSIFNEQYGYESNGLWVFDELLANIKYQKRQFVYSERAWSESYD